MLLLPCLIDLSSPRVQDGANSDIGRYFIRGSCNRRFRREQGSSRLPPRSKVIDADIMPCYRRRRRCCCSITQRNMRQTDKQSRVYIIVGNLMCHSLSSNWFMVNRRTSSSGNPNIIPMCSIFDLCRHRVITAPSLALLLDKRNTIVWSHVFIFCLRLCRTPTGNLIGS